MGIGIGSTVWVFKFTHREYRRDANGNAVGGPIYRKHWLPLTIIGETSRSWLCGPEYDPYKIPKKGPHPGFALTAKEVEDDCWVNDNRYKLTRIIDRLKDADKLRQIAEILGYKE